MRQIVVSIAVCLLASVLNVAAQESRVFHHLTHEEGLSDELTLAIAQDDRGFIWLGTVRGLNRFDGERVETYFASADDSSSLPHVRIDALLATRDHRLLIGTEDGLAEYDPHQDAFRRLPMERVRPESRVIVHAFDEAEDGTVWIGSWENGLLRLPPGSTVPEPVPLMDTAAWIGPTRGSVTVRAVLCEPGGALWLSTYVGVWRFDPATGSIRMPAWPTRTLEALRDVVSFRMAWDRQGRLLLSSFDGLLRIDPHTGDLERLRIDETGLEPGWNILRSLQPTGNGDVWIGTDAGLARMDESGRFFRHENDPANPSSIARGGVLGLLLDASGVLWSGSEGGVSTTDLFARPVRSLRHRTGVAGGLPPGNVWSVAETGDGRVWIGASGGFGTLEPVSGRFTAVPIRGVASQDVRVVFVDRQDRLWLATRERGPCLFDRVHRTCTFWYAAGEAPTEVYAMAETPDGMLWAGVFGGLLRYDPLHGVTRRFTSDPTDARSLSSNVVLALEGDASGTLWIGTEAGLDRYDRDTDAVVRVAPADGQPGHPARGGISQLLADGRGNLWIRGHGVRRLVLDSGTIEDLDPALPSVGRGLPQGFVMDHRGRLWIDYSGSLIALGVADTVAVHIEGLPGRRSIQYVTAASFRSPQGRLFLGFDDGMYVFHPDSIAANPFAPVVNITGVQRNADPMVRATPRSSVIELGPADKVVTFEFAAAHYADPGHHRYAFRLEGFDDDWRYSETGSATYTALPPDRYTFQVRAWTGNGLESAHAATLEIVVHPPWYETWWLRLFMLLSLATGVALVFRMRMQSVVAQNRELDRLVAERTLQLTEQSAELQRKAAELLQANEMKSRFFSNVSHELRSPLALITGYLDDMIERAGERRDPDAPRLKRVRELAERLGNHVGQLLDLARSDAGRLTCAPKRGNLAAFVQRFVTHFALAARKAGIQLVMETSSAALWTDFDPVKVDQILTNLVENALKFTPRGGTVWVSVDEDDGSARVRVADSGRGIPPEMVDRVFDRFFQIEEVLTRTHGGLGIGLALAREFAELHGGTLDVSSELGIGSVFVLRLPLTETGSRADDVPGLVFDTDEAEAPVGADAQTHARPRVLVVEDDPEMRAYLDEMLSRDFEVTTAADGVQGLATLRADSPDVVVSDVMMPNMSGLDLLREIRNDSTLHTLPVVLLTARAGASEQEEGLQALADDFVGKPFNPRTLRLRLLNLVAMRRRLKSGLRPLPDGADDEARAFVHRLELAILDRLDDPSLSIPELAEALFTSERTLHRRVKELSGLTAGAFVRQLRLDQARLMLEAGNAPSVSHVAREVGFMNVSHFARAYEDAFGRSPRAVLSGRPGSAATTQDDDPIVAFDGEER